MILETGSIPVQDSFSFLTTSPMIYPSWGISVIYAILYNVFEIEGLFLFHRLVFLTFQLITIKQLEKIDIGNSRNFYLSLIIMIGATFYSDRPAMIPIIYLSFGWHLLQGNMSYKVKLICLSLIAILWANTHGSVLFFAALLWIDGIYKRLISRQGKWPFLYPSAVSVCMFMNPFGREIVPYAIETASLSRQRGITEWVPTFISTPLLEIIFFYVLIIYTSYFFIKKRDYRILLHPFAFCLFFGLSAIRNVVWAFWLAVPSIIELELYDQRERRKTVSKFRNLTVGLLSLLLILMLPGLNKGMLKFAGKFKNDVQEYNIYSPDDMVTEIKERGLKGKIFHDIELGSFLVLKLRQVEGFKTYIDARNIIFSDDDLNKYKKVIMGGLEAEVILDQLGIDIILICKRESGLSQKIVDYYNWQIVKESKRHILAVRMSRSP